MKLRFYAREDQLAREAGVHRYYGRTLDPITRSYPATREAFEVEQGTEDGDKCSKLCRKLSLFAADKETAAAIGAEFIETEFVDGSHVVKVAHKFTAKPAKDAS